MIRLPGHPGARLALALVPALVLASCGSDDPAPLAPAPADTTRSMLFVFGEPRVSVSLDGSLVEASSGGGLTGSFRAILEDSTSSRVFLPRVRMNGASLVDETDPFGAPAQSTLDIATALPDLRLEDSLALAVLDGGTITPPFTVGILPSRVELLPDSTVVTKGGAAIRFRWSGRIERLVLTLTDRFGARVRYNLTFENVSGLGEVALPARDLAPLAPGPLTVAASITDVEARLVGPRLMIVNCLTTQRRTWTLAP
jgi:hypothetical protein